MGGSVRQRSSFSPPPANTDKISKDSLGGGILDEWEAEVFFGWGEGASADRKAAFPFALDSDTLLASFLARKCPDGPFPSEISDDPLPRSGKPLLLASGLYAPQNPGTAPTPVMGFSPCSPRFAFFFHL